MHIIDYSELTNYARESFGRVEVRFLQWLAFSMVASGETNGITAIEVRNERGGEILDGYEWNCRNYLDQLLIHLLNYG